MTNIFKISNKSIEVIHAELGFVTFLCSKTNGVY